MQSVEQVVSFLEKYQLSLVTAESCTGGLMASLLAGVPGCGAVLDRGYVAYSPTAKQQCLGVAPATIARYGLTSEEVAREMALGALANSEASVALANTGMAEAEGPLDGLVCVACAMLMDGEPWVVSEQLHFDGDRNQVREAAAQHVLLQLPYYYERLHQAIAARLPGAAANG
ncbi:CinA family protein [Pseudomonas solani]|uniref:CinA family protein n=1 Tax=Pseudomonas solani TaxID=2731552 RepID=UPI0035BE2DE7